MTRHRITDSSGVTRNYLAFSMAQFWGGIAVSALAILGAAYAYERVTVPPIAQEAVRPDIDELKRADRELRQTIVVENDKQDSRAAVQYNLLREDVKYLIRRVDAMADRNAR